MRYARDFRDDLDALKRVLVATPTGAQVPISMLADISYKTGPPLIRRRERTAGGISFSSTSRRATSPAMSDARPKG